MKADFLEHLEEKNKASQEASLKYIKMYGRSSVQNVLKVGVAVAALNPCKMDYPIFVCALCILYTFIRALKM